MRHHQTRRKGRDLKKKRTTRRRQHGGGEITSAKDWFTAVREFEDRKGTFEPNYTFASLADESLRLPSSVADIDKFIIPDVNVIYPPQQPPADYTPMKENISLIEIAQTITYMFYGEKNMGEGLINQGVNTLATFIQYVNNAKNVPDNTTNDQQYDNKRIVWYLNELEVALQNVADRTLKEGEPKFTSIYNATKYPFYILYLIANPVMLSTKPELTPIPPDILAAVYAMTMQQEHDVQAV